jgi:hypothetical protein
MRVGFWIARLISSTSLMIGKLKTDESRKEIRKRPGAPRAVA